MTPAPIFILYPMETSKAHKIYCFSFKNWALLFIPTQHFFLLDNMVNKLYANAPWMPNYNPKTSIQKYLTFSSLYNFFSANVSDFYTYFIAKNENFEL